MTTRTAALGWALLLALGVAGGIILAGIALTGCGWDGDHVAIGATASLAVAALLVAWATWPTAAVLAVALSSLTACQLGPRGRAAVTTTITVRTLDAACDAFLDGAISQLPAYVDESVAACKPTPDPVRCYNARVASREGAIKACEVYGRGRGSAEAAAAARAALAAIGVQ